MLPVKIVVPTSTYDILERIKEIALEEPLRMNMTFERRTLEATRNGKYPGYYKIPQQWPSCGCVGCVGGWSQFLVGPSAEDGEYCEVNLSALGKRLGLNHDQAEWLFYPEKPGLSWTRFGDAGTPEYARKVWNHIDEFQRMWEVQLKGWIVQPTHPALQD